MFLVLSGQCACYDYLLQTKNTSKKTEQHFNCHIALFGLVDDYPSGIRLPVINYCALIFSNVLKFGHGFAVLHLKTIV